MAFLMILAGKAQADESSVAQALFDEGRKLAQAGDYASACVRFEESQRLEPAGGTLMNLASCHSRTGKTAVAWEEFHAALDQARADGRADRVDEARRRIADLEVRLSKLVVVTTPADGLVISLDGKPVAPSSWGTPLLLDPGEHELRAVVPGASVWIRREAIKEGAETRVEVPVLKKIDPVAAASADTAHESSRASSAQSPGAYVAAGLAIVGIGIGSYYGLIAANKKGDSATAGCSADRCPLAGAALLREANTAAWISDVGFGAGLAAVTACIYLFARPSPARPSSGAWHVVPSGGSRALGAAAVVNF